MPRNGIKQSRPGDPHEGARQEQTAPVHHVRQSLHPTGELREAHEETHAGRHGRQPYKRRGAGQLQTELFPTAEG